jgi:hypothetical protein
LHVEEFAGNAEIRNPDHQRVAGTIEYCFTVQFYQLAAGASSSVWGISASTGASFTGASFVASGAGAGEFSATTFTGTLISTSLWK